MLKASKNARFMDSGPKTKILHDTHVPYTHSHKQNMHLENWRAGAPKRTFEHKQLPPAPTLKFVRGVALGMTYFLKKSQKSSFGVSLRLDGRREHLTKFLKKV